MKAGDRIKAFRGGSLEFGVIVDQDGELWVEWDNGGRVTIELLCRDCALQGGAPVVVLES